ncbi:MAG: hypothetical protein GQ576_05605 [Methanococcoides sp.]|nr:hypothetical protein [Methanococcoides sp.]
MYRYIAIAAYCVVLFLTLRDIRIFRRTRFDSYRKGAIKGIVASTVVLLGIIVVEVNAEIGLVIVFIGLYIHRNGIRENVFKEANTVQRLLGKRDI